jgi:hypothetical protein
MGHERPESARTLRGYVEVGHEIPEVIFMKPDGIGISGNEFIDRKAVNQQRPEHALLLAVEEDGHVFLPAFAPGSLFRRGPFAFHNFPRLCHATIRSLPKSQQSVDLIRDDGRRVASTGIASKKRIDAIRKKYSQAYASWSAQDDAYLRQRLIEGASIDDLVWEFGRQPSAIRSRLRKLGLDCMGFLAR